MSSRVRGIATPRFRRPIPEDAGPDRRGGGVFRTVGADAGIAGLPLDSLESAAVAAVRAGYRVADAQIARVQKIGDRVRRAGEEALGEESEKQALDHADKLINRSILAGLSWLEGVAAEPGSPLHRLAAVQYRLIGGVFGLDEAKPSNPPSRPSAQEGAASRPQPKAPIRPRVKFGGGCRRRVLVVGYELEAPKRETKLESLEFLLAEDTTVPSFIGQLDFLTTGPMLTVTVTREAPPGLWNAAICDGDAVEVGWIQIAI